MQHLKYNLSAFILPVLLIASFNGVLLQDHSLNSEQQDIDPILGAFKDTSFSSMADGYFIENIGQSDQEVLFIYNGEPQVLVHEDGITVTSTSKDGDTISYRMTVEGSSSPSYIMGSKEGPVFNYFYGSDPEEWVHSAPSFEIVRLNGLLPGIDMILKNTDQGPKWEIFLEKGSLLEDLSIRYESKFSTLLASNDHLFFRSEEMELSEGPFIYFQGVAEIMGSFDLKDDLLSFEMNYIDLDEPLLIDPLMSASTFIGGNGWDRGPKVLLHSSGDLIIAGTTESYDLDPHSSAYDRTFNGEKDIFIYRMSKDLSFVRYATYVGGSGYDQLSGIVTDASGYIYIAGQTSSSNYPTLNAFDGTYNSGGSDGMMTKFASNLGSITFSTYIGGSGEDWATGIDVDQNGAPYICGTTDSTDLPSTTGAYQTSLNGVRDGFVAKLDPDGMNLDYLTYLGGDGFGDEISDIDVDDLGRALVVGYSVSSDFPTTENAYRNGSGFYMGFVSRFEPDGSDLNMSTFLAYGTWINATHVDDDGIIYLTGKTVSISGEFPVSENAYDKDLSGYMDGYVCKMAGNGSTLLYSTYIGNNEQYGKPPEVVEDYIEYGTDVTSDGEGRPIVSGLTDSMLFPLTDDSFDDTNAKLDAFVTMLSPDLSRLEYSTFIGGHDEDRGTGVAYDPDGWLYLVGETYHDTGVHDFPTTEGAYQTDHRSQYDCFMTRFKMDSYLSGPPDNLTSTFHINTINLTWDIPMNDGNEPVAGYNVYRGNSPTSYGNPKYTTDRFYNDTGLIKGKTYYYMVSAINSVGEGPGNSTSNTPYSIPGSPTIVSVKQGSSHINISWVPPSDNGGTHQLTYIIEYGTEPHNIDIFVMDIDRNWYDIFNLTNGQVYYFRIKAVNHMGVSDPSEIGNSTPLGRPTPPRNLIAMLTDGAVTLSWEIPYDTGGSPSVLYNIYRWVNDTYFWAVEQGLTDHSHRITGLINGENYTFYVSAINLLGEGSNSEKITVTPFGRISEPFNLTGQENGNWVSLSWETPNITGNSNRPTYSVFLGYVPYNMTVHIDSTFYTNISIHDLIPGKEYYFAIMATNGVYNSTISETIMLRPLEVPTRPFGLNHSYGDSFINLSWKEPEYFGGAGSVTYSIHLGSIPKDIIPWGTTTKLVFNITGLENGLTYFVSIRAFNDKGPGPYSIMINVTPMAVPTPPRHLTYEDGDGSLNISWEFPFNDGGTERIWYNLYVGENNSHLDLFARDLSEKSYLLDGLINGRIYYIGVTSLNLMGESSMEGPIEAVPMTLPTAPIPINVTVVDLGLMINWAPPEDNGGSGVWYYRIYREDINGDMLLIAEVGGHALSFIDEDVMKGNTYIYAIQAETSYGDSPISEKISFFYPEDSVEDLKIDPEILGIAGGIAVIVLLLIVVLLFSSSRRKARERRMWLQEE